MLAYSNPHEVGSELWAEYIGNYIGQAVDDDSIAEHREPEPGRWHLGASEIGNPCSRAIWYSFRWVRKIEHSGQLHRLFRRGHREEAEFVRRLARIGIEARDRDPGTGKQYRINHPSEPHYGGSLDGIAYVPFLGMWVLCEFKTHNDKSFTKLVKDGLRKSKPRHYQQMCSYGKVYQLHFGLYCALNKNTDEYRFLFPALDWRFADMTDEKAIHIIRSHDPPRKISQSSADINCKFCDYRGVCHLKQPLAANCRSCRFATPNEHDTEWTCQHPSHTAVLPRDIVVTGCADYVPIC